MIANKTQFISLILDSLGVEYETEYRFHPVRKWRFDFAIPEKKVAIEYEGGQFTKGRHQSPIGFAGDIEKYNAAVLDGWKVIRFTTCHINKMYVIDTLKEVL